MDRPAQPAVELPAQRGLPLRDRFWHWVYRRAAAQMERDLARVRVCSIFEKLNAVLDGPSQATVSHATDTDAAAHHLCGTCYDLLGLNGQERKWLEVEFPGDALAEMNKLIRDALLRGKPWRFRRIPVREGGAEFQFRVDAPNETVTVTVN